MMPPPVLSEFDALPARHQHCLGPHPQSSGSSGRTIKKIGETQVCTSIIVAAELRYGATKKGSTRLTAQLEAVLGALEILPFDSPADSAYGLIRARLEQAGQMIGGNVLLIAAQGLAFGYTIVTDNQREFPREAGLVCQNWLR